MQGQTQRINQLLHHFILLGLVLCCCCLGHASSSVSQEGGAKYPAGSRGLPQSRDVCVGLRSRLACCWQPPTHGS